MKPILITLTEYHTDLATTRTFNVNHIITMETTSLRPGYDGTLLEVMGQSRVKVLESQPQITALVAQATHYACTKNEGTTDPAPASTDAFKSSMLTNYADNIIIPAYGDLTAKLTALETQINGFLDNPSTTTLDATKPAYKAAYLSYEATSTAYFGPAATLLLNSYLNTFPPAPTKI